jgi:hypothetical protein
MNIVVTWVVAMALILMIAGSWYVSQPIVAGIITASSSFENATLNGTALSKATSTNNLMYVLNLIWAPILAIVVLAWAVISSGRRDVESEMYG